MFSVDPVAFTGQEVDGRDRRRDLHRTRKELGPGEANSEARRDLLMTQRTATRTLAAPNDGEKLSTFSPWGAFVEAATDAGDRALRLSEPRRARACERCGLFDRPCACALLDDSHAALYGSGEDGQGLSCLSSATFVRSSWPTPVSPYDPCGILPDDPPFLDESLRRTILIPQREHWAARAAERYLVTTGPELDADGLPIDRAAAGRQYLYASQRVASLGRDITPKLRGCGRTVFPIACGCTSSRAWGAMTCRQSWLCKACRKARARKIAGKVEVGLDARMAGETTRAQAGAFGFGGWRSTIRIVLITLTVRHTGDVARDRDRVLRGWQNVRKRYHEEWGRFPSVLVWEVTPGDDGLGHVHAHVAVVWPHRDWGKIRRWWMAGTHDGKVPTDNNATSRINFSCGFRFKHQPRNTKKHPATARSMARYLAKYISKGADSSAFTAELTAMVSAAFYGQRSIVPSHGFWVPRDLKCPCCGLIKTKARGLAAEWFDREPPCVPEYDATAPPDELLDALERGELRGFVTLS